MPVALGTWVDKIDQVFAEQDEKLLTPLIIHDSDLARWGMSARAQEAQQALMDLGPVPAATDGYDPERPFEPTYGATRADVRHGGDVAESAI